jgi:asparagine synthase (glutamine-hydrolysing)
MCGIAGFTHRQSAAARERIQAALAFLIHRGPDQQGVFESDSVALGAARLKIIDLKGGDQPIFSDDRNLVIAFNGEIYNHAELRRELERLGHTFRSQTDTETVLEAFRAWDIDCFRRFRGMFAVALWTESTRRLVLARARIGIKPLYIARHAAHLYFGSEMKTIFVHPEIERRLSLQGLDCYLSLNYVPAPHTLIEGIEKLRPGFWLEWRDGKERSENYWELPRAVARHGWTMESATEELDTLLQRSVREHLLSDVPLGVWLSGGVDSTTILHYASQATSNRLKTFSVSFKGHCFDESDYIRQVVSAYGTQHEQIDLNEDLALQEAIEEFAYYSDDPNGDAGALPVWFLSKLTRNGATVALSGEGADELFGGYLTYRADLLAQRARLLPAAVRRMARDLSSRIPVSDEKIGFDYKVKRFLDGSLMGAEQAHVFWNGTFSDAQKQQLTQLPLPGALHSLLETVRRAADGLDRFLWFDQQFYLPDDILAKVDRISMAHSLEVRPPFLDHRIVEFAASLPSGLLIRGARQKLVLKELMKDKLPSAVLKRKKTGFDIPAHAWLRGPLRSLLVDTIAAGLAEHSGLFIRSAVERHLERHLERIENLGYNLWGLMILFLWMRRWKIQTTPALEMGEEVRARFASPIS